MTLYQNSPSYWNWLGRNVSCGWCMHAPYPSAQPSTTTSLLYSTSDGLGLRDTGPSVIKVLQICCRFRIWLRCNCFCPPFCASSVPLFGFLFPFSFPFTFSVLCQCFEDWSPINFFPANPVYFLRWSLTGTKYSRLWPGTIESNRAECDSSLTKDKVHPNHRVRFHSSNADMYAKVPLAVVSARPRAWWIRPTPNLGEKAKHTTWLQKIRGWENLGLPQWAIPWSPQDA